MYPTQHAAATVVATAVLRWRGWGAVKLAAFAAGGVLLDVDHYLSYAARSGDLSLRRAYLWNRDRGESVRKKLSPHVPSLGFESRRPFHWLPLIVAPAALALTGRSSPRMAQLLVALTAGAVFHRTLDAAWESAWSSDPPPPPRPPRPLPPVVARTVRRLETAALITRHVARCVGQRRMPW